MPFQGIQARDINEGRLRSLIDGQTPEGKTIDYKLEFPAPQDKSRKDFLADLCSFANTAGGHIIYGMSESNASPLDLVGIAGDIDTAVQRMENMARDGIRPPIPGLLFVRVTLSNGKEAVVASIPKSWNAPHQVVFQKDCRFYTRGSAGKHPIDVDELRQIVLLSQETGERIRQFRANRVGKILSGDTRVKLQPAARQILHFVPLNAFGTGVAVNLTALEQTHSLLVDTMDRAGVQRHNVDGLLAFSEYSGQYEGYAQVYRNGILEVVVPPPECNKNGRSLLQSLAFEKSLFKQSSAALKVLKSVFVAAPIAVMLSFTGIKGWEIDANFDWGHRRYSYQFDDEPLLIPELMLESLEIDDIRRSFTPIVDRTWNAAGFPKSDYWAQDEK